MTDEELNRLVANYRPNSEVLKAIFELKLVGTIGPSASGKNTIMRAAEKLAPKKVHDVLGETTRKPRSTEQAGIHYIFRDKPEVIKDMQAGRLVSVIIHPSNELYFTRLSNYSKTTTNTLAILISVLDVFRNLPFESFKPAFIVPQSYEKWRTWLDNQAQIGQWSEKDWSIRLKEAEESYRLGLEDKEMTFILNDEIDMAAKRLIQLIDGQEPDDQVQARKIAEQNYQKLIKTL